MNCTIHVVKTKALKAADLGLCFRIGKNLMLRRHWFLVVLVVTG